MAYAVDYVAKAWRAAKDVKDVSVFIECEQFTKQAVREMFPLRDGPDYMKDGRITSAHFLTADGWLDVVMGTIVD